ncbi:MAG: M55 family metallopeptidase [Flavonifractor plautii]
MKVFISADIEGTAVTATREGCRPGEFEYERSRKEMTAEVVAAAEGARAAGAELVVVKDAHGTGLNILPEELPEYVQLIRSWSGSPEMMVEGLDSSFDAAFFVGYHNAAGEGGNALSHTINGGVVHRITVNGQPASEFLIYSWMAAWYGVPSVLLTGDKTLCEVGAELHPSLVTVPVKDDVGGRSQGLSPVLAHRRIREGRAGSEAGLVRRPYHPAGAFPVELTYKSHRDAYTKGFYPGAERWTR